MISFREIRECLIAELYVRTMSGRSDDFIVIHHYDGLNVKLTIKVDDKLIRKAAINLRGDGFLEEHSEGYPGGLEISGSGILFVENHLENKIEPICSYVAGGGFFGVGKSADGSGSQADVVPASDRTVTLNHNQSDYQQAVEALDRVLEEFRNDHRLDNELGPLKDAHLKVLEGGRKALEDKEISVGNGQDWIVKPLKWIVEKFADGALKVLAMKALEAIGKLL